MKKRHPIDILRGFFLLCHPGPVLFHTIAVTALAFLALWPHLSWSIFTLIITAHLAMQLSIATFNDYCDRQRDALGKKNKPIVAGLVRPREALIATFFLMFIMVLLLILLNPLALLVSLLYLAFGQGYNLGLKATPLSGIVFALAIPLIPVYAFVSAERFVPLVFWQIPVAALMGVAINLANSLPDIQEDTASRTRTLAVALGERGSFIACSLLLILAAIVTVVLAITGLVPAHLWLLLITVLSVSLVVGVLFLLFGAQKSSGAYKTYFYLMVLLCLVLAGGWLTSALI